MTADEAKNLCERVTKLEEEVTNLRSLVVPIAIAIQEEAKRQREFWDRLLPGPPD